MRHASCTITLGKIMWSVALACCLQATLMVVAVETADAKSEVDNLQVVERSGGGWRDFHGGWGKRNVPSWEDQNNNYMTPVVDKRAWRNLQGGWGKRYDYDYPVQDIATILDRNDYQNSPMELDDDLMDIHEDQKRNWNKFSDGWGKRAKWEKFRGSWGKREPAWSNLKGIWGKRSMQGQLHN